MVQIYGVALRLLSAGFREILQEQTAHIADPSGKNPMRSFILSVSADRWLTPIRNTVLAHAGYAVIPSLSAEAAMQVLLNRHVSAMVIGHSIPPHDRQRLCSEGRRHGVPAVVLDRNTQVSDVAREIHVDPSDGPEAFLNAIAALLADRAIN
jgi:hypothetical protein